MRPGRVNPNALAVRRFRQAHPDYAERERKRTTARWEALQALARRHVAEFTALYAAELAHAGLDTGPPMEKPCGCGGVIRRRSPYGRWPASCEDCATPAARRLRESRAAGDRKSANAA